MSTKLEQLKQRREELIQLIQDKPRTQEQTQQQIAQDITPTGNERLDNLRARRAELVQEIESRNAAMEGMPKEWKSVGKEALRNIPRSAIELGKNMWHFANHPITSIGSIGTAVLGGIEKLIPGEQKSEKVFNTMVDFYKDRFGGLENLKKTMANDPVGFLTDIAGFITGAGAAVGAAGKAAGLTRALSLSSKASKVTDLARTFNLSDKASKVTDLARTFNLSSKAAKTQKLTILSDRTIHTLGIPGLTSAKASISMGKLARIERAAGNIAGIMKKGVFIDPITGPVKLLNFVAKKTIGDFGRLARSIGGSALAPDIQTPGLDELVKLKAENNLVDAAIRHTKLRVTLEHAEHFNEIKKQIGNKIGNVVDKATDAGIKVETSKLISAVDDIINKELSKGLKTIDSEAIVSILSQWRNKTIKDSPKTLTARQAHDLKTALNKNFIAGDNITAAKALADDALRDVAMKELEKVIPELKKLNPKWAESRQLSEAIASRIRGLSKKPVGALGVISGLGGATLASAIFGQGASMSLFYGAAAAGGVIGTNKIFTSPNVQLAVARLLKRINSVTQPTGKILRKTEFVPQVQFQAGRFQRELKKKSQKKQEKLVNHLK